MIRLSSWAVAASLVSVVLVGLCLSQIPVFAHSPEKPLTVRIASIPGVAVDDSTLVIGQMGEFGGIQGQGKMHTPVAPATNPNTPPQPTLEPEFRTAIALKANSDLDREHSLQFESDIDSLADELNKQLSVPVILDNRGIEQAKLAADQVFQFQSSDEPLRTTLRKTLQPLGLRAVVQDEGIVITADFTELTRNGISTDKWVGMSDELVASFEAAFDKKLSASFPETPLNEAVRSLSEQTSYPMMINKLALEGNGLSEDSLVDIDLENVSLRSFLSLMLRDLELTYTIRSGLLVITTRDDAENQLRTRLYFLEGTGLPRGDYESAMMLIQQTIDPDSWEALGGVGTMAPIGNGKQGRPALLMSATMTVHEQVADLFQSLRETHFGPDPVSTSPAVAPRGHGGGGMGGGGMF